MQNLKGQLTLRGVLIGCAGCVVITAASAYTALKMGALPWPIVFVAIISLFFLKALGRGKANLNEVNVTHTVMSAGAMVAGGLAFTIPGIWMLGYADEMSWKEMLLVALCGVVLGLICTVLLRRHFIEKEGLPYPIGEAAAQTLIAGNTGGKMSWKLFGSMAFAGIYTALRDWMGLLPVIFFNGVSLPGVAFGIYNSPMLLAVGFLVGTGSVFVLFAGALFSNFGLIIGGTNLGFWSLSAAGGIVSSLGMGVMMGAGLGVIFKNILPEAIRMLKNAHRGTSEPSRACTSNENASVPESAAPQNSRVGLSVGVAALGMAAVALFMCMGLNLGPLPCIAVVILVWVATAMSAQSVGQTGIDPMEIFGLIILLVVAALSEVAQVQLFFIAGIVAVACGLAGDVMNDFRAGYVIGTNPRAQWIGQAIGAVVGAVVSVAVLCLLLFAYGPQAFGPHASFVSVQASVVATMVAGIPSAGAFVVGLAGGLLLFIGGFPAMMLGLGIYLPFYMSAAAFVGAALKMLYELVGRRKRAKLSTPEQKMKKKEHEVAGLIVSSGLLGGESIVGVMVALVAVLSNLGG